MIYPLAHKHVRRVVFTLDDGTEETWEFPPEDRTALYRVSSNRTKETAPVLETWKEHQLQWTSDRVRPLNPPPVEMVPVPVVDKWGRSTGGVMFQPKEAPMERK